MVALAAAVAGGACGGGRSVAVRVSLAGTDSADAALEGVVVVAVPYDRDSIVAELERRQGSPRPHTAELDSIYARFRTGHRRARPQGLRLPGPRAPPLAHVA